MLNFSNEVNVSTCEYFPLFGISLPRKHNPVIVSPIRNSKISVNVELMRDEGLELIDAGEALERYLFSFYRFVRDELNFNYGFRVVVGGPPTYKGFTYVAVTNAMARILAGRLTDEVYGFLNVVDSRLGVPECVTALRLYDRVVGAYIWRYGDEAVKIEGLEASVKSVSSVTKAMYRNSIVGNEQVSNVLTHLIGQATIEVFKSLISRDVEMLHDYINLLNKVWESIYVLDEQYLRSYSSGNTYLYVRDFDEVLILEIELRL
ncbi:MAG: hypothetical protein RMH77_05630 [Sulfolobales archaeon]|nr:hypothetical protein [Sulfolobales archaeon]MCX8186801.1 hypothetical protein [Sulfolobales archaeon]MDW7969866.1 hypothetical protein [Sulfolobales archaeon]